MSEPTWRDVIGFWLGAVILTYCVLRLLGWGYALLLPHVTSGPV